jgi:hypothetical protein
LGLDVEKEGGMWNEDMGKAVESYKALLKALEEKAGGESKA